MQKSILSVFITKPSTEPAVQLCHHFHSSSCVALELVDDLVVEGGDLLHLVNLGLSFIDEIVRVNVLGDLADIPTCKLLLDTGDIFTWKLLTLISGYVRLIDKSDELNLVISLISSEFSLCYVDHRLCSFHSLLLLLTEVCLV